MSYNIKRQTLSNNWTFTIIFAGSKIRSEKYFEKVFFLKKAEIIILFVFEMEHKSLVTKLFYLLFYFYFVVVERYHKWFLAADSVFINTVNDRASQETQAIDQNASFNIFG